MKPCAFFMIDFRHPFRNFIWDQIPRPSISLRRRRSWSDWPNVPFNHFICAFSPSALDIRRCIDGSGRWVLRELSLDFCDVTEELASAIAGSAGVSNLSSLTVLDPNFTGTVARALFSSWKVRSLVHLNLGYSRMGTEGAIALASAPGLDHLRSLNVVNSRMMDKDLQKLLASANLRHLTWLSVGESGYQLEPPWGFSSGLATQLTRMPCLARLRLSVANCDPQSRQILTTSESLAWPVIECTEDTDRQHYRANRAPDQFPPVDLALEPEFGRDWS